jgi:hypothetical protein
MAGTSRGTILYVSFFALLLGIVIGMTIARSTAPSQIQDTPRESTFDASTVAVPLYVHNDKPVIELAIAGRKHLFEIDMTSRHTLISSQLARELSVERYRVDLKEGKWHDFACLIEAVNIVGANFFGVTAVIDPAFHDTPVQGLLGYRFFADCSVEFNYPSKQLLLRKRFQAIPIQNPIGPR